MQISKHGWRLAAFTGTALLVVASAPAVALAAPGSARPDGSAGWQISATVGSATSEVNNGDIVATGSSDAWTSWTCGPCPTGSDASQNLMFHWNGSQWSPVTLASQLSYPAVLAGMGASSARNLWVFDDSDQLAVYNGATWAVKSLPSWVVRPIDADSASVATAVFSASDGWAFSIDAEHDPTLAARYHGGSWHKVELPIIPNSADGLSPKDIWLSGYAKGYGPRTLAHWNGKTWKTLSFPHPPKGATLIESGLVALGAKSLWVLAEQFGPKAGAVTSELLRWTGKWRTVKVPASVGTADQLAADGHGGLWLIASPSGQVNFVHYTAGHWDVSAVPTQAGLTAEPGVLASVPGSRSMWSIGFLVSGSTPEYGAEWRFAG